MHNFYSLNSTVFLEHWHLGQWFSCSMTIFERQILFRTHGKETDQKSSPTWFANFVFQRCHTVTFWDIMSRIPTSFLESPQWILSQTSLPPNTFKCPKQVQASEVFLGCYNHQNKCRFWIFCTMPVATRDSHLEFLSDLIQKSLRSSVFTSGFVWTSGTYHILCNDWKSLFSCNGNAIRHMSSPEFLWRSLFFCRGIPHFQTNPSGCPIWPSDHPINPFLADGWIGRRSLGRQLLAPWLT